MTVRTAGPDDLEEIIKLGLMECEEIGLAPGDPERLRARYLPLVHRHGGMIGVIGDKELTAFIPLAIESPWYSTDPVLADIAFFVHPEHRSSEEGQAQALCRYAMDAADSLGLPLSVGVITTRRTGAKARIFKSLLGDPAGAMFLYRPNGHRTEVQTGRLDDLPLRIGTTRDVHEVMDLALKGWRQNGFVRPDPRRVLEECWPALTGDGGMIGMLGKPGEPLAGAILIRRSKLWYSGTGYLDEKALFVDQAHRAARGGAAARLCEFGKLAAERMSLPLSIGVLANERTEAKVRLYRRQFGEPVGAYFLWGARTGEVSDG
jgi:hypothetical protein